MSIEHKEYEYNTMITDMNLDHFKDSGALWWINRQLHLLGMALALDVDEKGHCYNLRPVWCKFRGFDEEHETMGFEKLTRYFADNGDVLLGDIKEEEWCVI